MTLLDILILVGCALGLYATSFYVLWVLFLAIMNLKRVRDAGLLHKHALILGMPLLFLGLLVDLLCNVMLSLPMLELPRELTVTARLKRHNKAASGYRKAVALLFEPILDPYDPSGDHI